MDVTGPSDALDRRARTRERLAAESVPVDPGLPLLPGENEVRLPRAEEIVLRAICLTLVAA